MSSIYRRYKFIIHIFPKIRIIGSYFPTKILEQA